MITLGHPTQFCKTNIQYSTEYWQRWFTGLMRNYLTKKWVKSTTNLSMSRMFESVLGAVLRIVPLSLMSDAVRAVDCGAYRKQARKPPLLPPRAIPWLPMREWIPFSLSAVSISHPGIISVRSPAVDLIWAMFCFSRKAARNPSLPDAAAIFLPLFFPRCNRQETRSLLMIPPRQLHRRHPHSPMKWSKSPAPDAHALHFIFWTGDSSSSDIYMNQHSPV